MSFERGQILICIVPSHFIERGELVRFEGKSIMNFVKIIDKPGHYGRDDFRPATSAEIWKRLKK